MAALDKKKLEAIVAQQIALAQKHDKDERESERSKAIDYYLGDMDKYVPPEANRSKVVSRDVADTIGWMLPGIMRVFTASDKMAEAEPVEEEDFEFAHEATEGMNYVFWKDNDGYRIVHNATHDALLIGNSITKTFYDDTPIYTTTFHSGLSEDQVALLLMPDADGDEPEVLAQSEHIETLQDPETGETIEVVQYDLKIKRKKADGKFTIEVIPPESFLIDEDAVSTEDAAFTAHWSRKTRSALVGMGYSKSEIKDIPEAGKGDTPEEAARRNVSQSDTADASTELVDYFECYMRIDVDGDGESELIRACYAGGENGTLLDWEVWEDDHPFDDIPCDPVPHRWTARSIADETIDVQDIKTVLLRQALNNTYASNKPQRFVKGKIKNPDELDSPSFGGVVYGDPSSEVQDLSVPFVANHAFEAIAYQDEVIQRRTGVGRRSMALDGDALQNQTATASNNDKDASYSQIELVARNMAEFGWTKVFRKLMRLMIKHQGPRTLLNNGKKIPIDPRHWNADMAVTINVGLGTGSRERDLIMLGRVLESQMLMTDRFMGAGAVNEAIDMLPKILRTMVKMAESAGIKNPEEFYPEYTNEKVEQLKKLADERSNKPDPKEAAVAAKMQADQQLQQGKATMDAEAKNAQAQRDHEYRMAQLAAKENLDKIAVNDKLALAKYQTDKELELKQWQIEQEMEMNERLGLHKANISSSVQLGGDAG